MNTMSDFKVGQRVELLPHLDLWMMGARYGEVVKLGRKWVHVKLDRGTNWVVQLLPVHLTVIGMTCPDGGRCHHDCTTGCFRVNSAGPLSDIYPNDQWPAEVVAAHTPTDGVL
jgi:hypothetical protein